MAERPFLSEVYLSDEIREKLRRPIYRDGRRHVEPKPEVKYNIPETRTIEKVNNLEETQLKK